MSCRYLCFSLLLAVGAYAAGPLEGKGPPYFVDRYGPAKSATTVTKQAFVDPHWGAVPVKGQFSVRIFAQDKLKVEAVFALPSLQLVAVNLRMAQKWTDEQIEAALKAYGAEWKPSGQNSVVKTWLAPDGSRAVWLLSSLHIESKVVVDLVNKALAEQDTKRKAVPTF